MCPLPHSPYAFLSHVTSAMQPGRVGVHLSGRLCPPSTLQPPATDGTPLASPTNLSQVLYLDSLLGLFESRPYGVRRYLGRFEAMTKEPDSIARSVCLGFRFVQSQSQSR